MTPSSGTPLVHGPRRQDLANFRPVWRRGHAHLCAFKMLAESLAPVVLPDADGCEIRLGSLWERQPAVVVFLRHYG